MRPPIDFKLNVTLAPGAVLPVRKSEEAAGYDLCANIPYQIVLWPDRFVTFSTGVSIEFPVGYFGRVASRSGLCRDHAVHIIGGIIDSDYRGEIHLILVNNGPEQFLIDPGMRVAQLIIEKHYVAEWYVVQELAPTTRGAAGLGSSGLK